MSLPGNNCLHLQQNVSIGKSDIHTISNLTLFLCILSVVKRTYNV